jgi:hypothetical protein
MIVGGYGGWWLGDYCDFALMGCFLVSTAGSVVGVCVV